MSLTCLKGQKLCTSNPPYYHLKHRHFAFEKLIEVLIKPIECLNCQFAADHRASDLTCKLLNYVTQQPFEFKRKICAGFLRQDFDLGIDLLWKTKALFNFKMHPDNWINCQMSTLGSLTFSLLMACWFITGSALMMPLTSMSLKALRRAFVPKRPARSDADQWRSLEK